MKKLSKLVYLCIALVVMTSCEQETSELEDLNKSNDEALIQEYESLTELIESGIDIQSYMESTINETPQFKGSTKFIQEFDGITIHDSREDLPCNDLPTEDFEEGVGSSYTGFPAPLNENTDNSFFNQGDILPGINFTTSNANDNVDHFVFFEKNHPNSSSNKIGANYNAEYLIIDFTDSNVFTVGMDISSFSSASTTQIQVFGNSGLIFETNILAALTGTFFGISSEESITQITINSLSNRNEFVDNISFGKCSSVYVGECGTKIENDSSSNLSKMHNDVEELMYQVCEESHKFRRPWERPYDIQKAFQKGIQNLAMGWVFKGQVTWSEAADILRCVADSGIDFEYYCDHEPN